MTEPEDVVLELRAEATETRRWAMTPEATRKPEGIAALDRLANVMSNGADEIERLRAMKDGAYDERDRLVVALGKLAQRLGGECWLGLHTGDPWEDDWRNIVFIKLRETGQLSWHIHDSELRWFEGWIDSEVSDEDWDGHTTEEKYARLARLAPTTGVS